MSVVENGVMDAATANAASGADDGLTIGRVAELVGVSVRTLHHWDEIGLVSPATRTWADYRVYRAADIERIQQVTCTGSWVCPCPMCRRCWTIRMRTSSRSWTGSVLCSPNASTACGG